ncbi:MAG: GatB/YqeY domain-containing protein [Vulcanimicrobiaceae bacterium]
MGVLKDRLTADLKTAMKAREQLRVDTIRSALSAFTYKRTEAGVELSDADELAVVQKLSKQRSDSITEFTRGNRLDLAEKEQAEKAILAEYLPQQKSADEVRSIVRDVLASLPADGRNQGAVMKAVMPQLKGLADGNIVRQAVESELAAQA